MNELSSPPSAAPLSYTEASGLDIGPVPVEPYRSPEFHELDREKVFRRAWLLMGRVEEIPEPGDYVLKEVEILKASVIVSRQKDGSIKAHHNVCSHRGNRVVQKPKGRATKFACGYHKWTYTNDGELFAIPDEPSFFNVDKKACGLTPVHLDIFEGWIFLNFAKQPEVDLATFLGPMRDHLAGFTYANAEHQLVIRADLDCNWKVASDAFSEAYHIPAIHPRTIGETFSSKENPFAHVLDARILGTHRYTSMYGNPDFMPDESSQIERLAASLNEAGSVIAAGGVDEMREFLAHPSINPTRSPFWAMDVNHVFPCTHIDTGPGGFWILQFWPVTYNTCRFEGRFHVPRAKSAKVRFQQELFVGRVVEVWLEDLSNCAQVQLGLESGAKDYMQLQDNEILIRHGIDQILRWTEAETVAEALGLEGASA